jgi:Arylsulfotransferase (ASST)
MSSRTSRRGFLKVGAAVLVGTKAAHPIAFEEPALSPSSQSARETTRFRSRPDLTAPLLDVRRGSGAPAKGYVCITPAGPMLVDQAGDPVWIHPVAHASTNLQVQRYDGRDVLTWWQGSVADYGIGYGEYVVMDGSYRQLVTVRGQNGLKGDLHEFSIGPNGVAYFTAYRTYQTDLSSVGGPKKGEALDATVQGVDLRSGNLVFDWHSVDHIDFSETYQPHYKGTPFDPVHLNSIDFTADGNLLLSARNTWTVYKIDRDSGEVVWRLGGKSNDFDMGDGADFSWQHHARVHPGGRLSLFDNEAVPAEAQQSRAVVLDVDESGKTANLVRQYEHPGNMLIAGSQGSCQLLPGGGVMIGWGSQPYYTELGVDGDLVLDAELGAGTSYRAFCYDWTGTPLDLPAVATEEDSSGRTLVFASWNGSTETVRWRLLVGRSAHSLLPSTEVERAGFETVIPVPAGASYVAVAAVDRRREVLARSTVRSV